MCYKISTIVGIDASYSSRKFEKKLLNHGLLESEKPKCPGDYDHEWTGIHPKFLIEKILYLSFVYILETQHVALSHNKVSHRFFFCLERPQLSKKINKCTDNHWFLTHQAVVYLL